MNEASIVFRMIGFLGVLITIPRQKYISKKDEKGRVSRQIRSIIVVLCNNRALLSPISRTSLEPEEKMQ